MKPAGVPLGKAARASCESTEGSRLVGHGVQRDREERDPTKKTIAITPRIPSVRAALRAWGRRNALTPLAIASTPVSAVEPEANARRRTKRPIVPTPVAIGCSAAVGPRARRRAGTRRSAISTSIEAMNA